MTLTIVFRDEGTYLLVCSINIGKKKMKREYEVIIHRTKYEYQDYPAKPLNERIIYSIHDRSIFEY